MKLRSTILLHDVLAAINRWEIHHCPIEWQLLSDEQIHAYLRYASAKPGTELWGMVEELTGRPITNFEEVAHGKENR